MKEEKNNSKYSAEDIRKYLRRACPFGHDLRKDGNPKDSR